MYNICLNPERKQENRQQQLKISDCGTILDLRDWITKQGFTNTVQDTIIHTSAGFCRPGKYKRAKNNKRLLFLISLKTWSFLSVATKHKTTKKRKRTIFFKDIKNKAKTCFAVYESTFDITELPLNQHIDFVKILPLLCQK